MEIFLLILLIIICENGIIHQTFSINTENYIAVTCLSEDNCDNLTHNIMTTDSSENIEDAFELDDINEGESNINYHHTTEIKSTTISTTTLPGAAQTSFETTMLNNIHEIMITNLTSKSNSIRKSYAEICTCDMTVSECDINCCCDNDCTMSHLEIFSHCTDRQTRKYDSRYCYTKNFFQRNNTVFMLEKLTDNLFCITYDNLPSAYSKSNSIKVGNWKKFDEIMMRNVKKEFNWVQNKLLVTLNFNNSIPYRIADTIWQLQSKSLNPFKIPMSGFTSECTFRKNIQYLKDFNLHCLQKKLFNDNSDLFIDMYSNFTVISSPIFFNSTYISSLNGSCPKNICIPIEIKYCTKSSSLCEGVKPFASSCVNSTCKNIVKKVHYIITHNGTMGIQKIQVNIVLANVSRSFYQHFHVQYRWAYVNEQKIYHRSGNPGYLIGKPIIIGSLKPNTTDEIANGKNNLSTMNYYLTIPAANKDGKCDENNRRIVNLGEDIKLKCRITLETINFTIDSCVQLHNKILTTFLEKSYINFTDIEYYEIYISKLGNITNENSDNVSNWDRILFNKVPNKILKSKKTTEKVHCSGFQTTMVINILYSLLPKPNVIDNYKIIGVGITLSEEQNFNWPKCSTPNCTDILELDLFTYVKFHDISTPETYYYAGGPNLDISLPYDFFYPFLSGKSVRLESTLFIFINIKIIILMYI